MKILSAIIAKTDHIVPWGWWGLFSAICAPPLIIGLIVMAFEPDVQPPPQLPSYAVTPTTGSGVCPNFYSSPDYKELIRKVCELIPAEALATPEAEAAFFQWATGIDDTRTRVAYMAAIEAIGRDREQKRRDAEEAAARAKPIPRAQCSQDGAEWVCKTVEQ